MYLLYTDASGTPDLQDASKEYVVVGVAIPTTAWQEIDQRVRAVKERYGLGHTKAELHAKAFCIDIREQAKVPDFDKLSWNERRVAVLAVRAQKLSATSDVEERARRRQRYRETEPFIHLSRAERNALFVDALESVASAETVLFAEVIRKLDCKDDIVGQAFTQVVSRFDSFLERRNQTSRRWLQRALERHPTAKAFSGADAAHVSKGMLIMDKEPARETSYRSMLAKFRDSGHPWGNLKHVIEAPFFVDSATSAAVQLADICAYAVRRYIEFGVPKGAGSHEETNFLRIFTRFDRSAKLHGIRHYCAKGACACRICQERGHAAT